MQCVLNVLINIHASATGTLAFMTVGGEPMDMKLPTESPSTDSKDRLLRDLRGLPDSEVPVFHFCC